MATHSSTLAWRIPGTGEPGGLPSKSLLQHHNSKASILQPSVFLRIQLISVDDYWKNRSFDCTNLYWLSDVSAF